MKVTEEEYNEHMFQAGKRKQEEQVAHAIAQTFKREVDESGFNEIPHYGVHEIRSDYYKNRLLEVLKQHKMKSINEAEQAKQTSDVSTSSAVQIFNNFMPVLAEKKDSYESRIDELFAVCEEQLPFERISIQQYEAILELFQVGYISDLSYFLRFEKLKRADSTHYYRRLYKY